MFCIDPNAQQSREQLDELHCYYTAVMAGHAMLLVDMPVSTLSCPLAKILPSVLIDTCRWCNMVLDTTFVVTKFISCNSASPADKSHMHIISKPQANQWYPIARDSKH